MYIKPTNTFSYLLTTSNHPSFIFKNIPKGIFIRVRRICSYDSDYFHFARIFYFELLKKGFDKIILEKTIRMVGNLNRNILIKYKDKNQKIDFVKTIFFQLPFNFNYLNLEKFFFNFKFKDNLSYLNVKLINNMSPNLSKILIHNFSLFKPSFHSYKKCNKLSCKTCLFSNNFSYFKLDNFYFPIMTNSSCDAKNVVYIIFCKSCYHFYIGQTNNIKNRIRAHKRNILINNYENEIETKNLIKHFNLPNHSLRKDFTFVIFKKDINSLVERLNLENQLIHLFLNLKQNVLNDKYVLADIYKYKNHNYLFK